jgi:hypothetical protein
MRLGIITTTAVGSLIAMVGIGAAPPASAAPTHAAAVSNQYVALGDSYTSGPLILPVSPTAPLDCLQSAVDYPHLAAAAEGLSLTDRSCSGATTADMTTAQYADQPPQFASLTTTTGVVTIGIGGNDNSLFTHSLETCIAIDLFDPFNIGSPCKAAEGSTYTNDIKSDAAVVGAAFAKIHSLSPSAEVFVVGYPDVLPQQGNCYAQIPLTTGDVAYLNGLEKSLDAMLQSEAVANGATFVDTFTPSIGHDACKAESARWIEPPVPSSDAFPVHPNARGEAADAADVEVAFQRAGIG